MVITTKSVSASKIDVDPIKSTFPDEIGHGIDEVLSIGFGFEHHVPGATPAAYGVIGAQGDGCLLTPRGLRDEF